MLLWSVILDTGQEPTAGKGPIGPGEPRTGGIGGTQCIIWWPVQGSAPGPHQSDTGTVSTQRTKTPSHVKQEYKWSAFVRQKEVTASARQRGIFLGEKNLTSLVKTRGWKEVILKFTLTCWWQYLMSVMQMKPESGGSMKSKVLSTSSSCCLKELDCAASGKMVGLIVPRCRSFAHLHSARPNLYSLCLWESTIQGWEGTDEVVNRWCFFRAANAK